jgi:hypothetical protein
MCRSILDPYDTDTGAVHDFHSHLVYHFIPVGSRRARHYQSPSAIDRDFRGLRLWPAGAGNPMGYYQMARYRRMECCRGTGHIRLCHECFCASQLPVFDTSGHTTLDTGGRGCWKLRILSVSIIQRIPAHHQRSKHISRTTIGMF